MSVRRIFTTMLLLFAFSISLLAAEGRAKYVILLIGDGMGHNIEKLYRTQVDNTSFSKFPKEVMTGTNNFQGKVTDSAASGTAIACGIKTYNSAIGMNKDKKPVTSLAKILHKKGFKVGIISSVGINDATPATHYANNVTRKNRPEIINAMPTSGFEFFGISSMLGKFDQKKFRKILRDNGYYIGKEDDLYNVTKHKKSVIFCDTLANWDGRCQTPRLADMTREAIKALDNEKGFFLMVEGGAIDHFAHSNDAGGVIREMIEFDAAIAEALKFYDKHPNETLIVVTADHDTGGLDILPGKTIPRNFWKRQTVMQAKMQNALKHKLAAGATTDAIIDWMCRSAGSSLPDDKEREQLRKAADLTFKGKKTSSDKMTRSMGYGSYAPLSIEVFRRRDRLNGIKFTTFGHTDRKIATKVIGAGAKYFNAPMENSDIPHNISKAVLGNNTELSKNLK